MVTVTTRIADETSGAPLSDFVTLGRIAHRSDVARAESVSESALPAKGTAGDIAQWVGSIAAVAQFLWTLWSESRRTKQPIQITIHHVDTRTVIDATSTPSIEQVEEAVADADAIDVVIGEPPAP